MSEPWPTAVYLLCLATSAACALLLTRAFLASRGKLLFWTAVSFWFLSLNNLLLVADMLVFATVDLQPYRHAAALAAIGTLLYGFIWESER